MKSIVNYLDRLPRQSKLGILLFTDVVLIAAAFYMAFALRHGEIVPIDYMNRSWVMLPALMVIGGWLSIVLGLSKIKLHTFEIQDAQRIGLCALLLIPVAMSLSYLFALGAPRSVPIIFGVLFFAGAVGVRINGLFILLKLQNIGKPKNSVIIYGAGAAGGQLASALRQSNEVNPVAFIDDNKALQGLIIMGLSIYGPEALEALVKKRKVKRILIAIPSLTKKHKIKLVKKLEKFTCEVQILPSYVEMIQGNGQGGKGIADSLRSVSPDDLLGRDKLDTILPDVAGSYYNKSVFVSGAGGSIGSELCRQILKFTPSKLVLFERSELALYFIEQELQPIADNAGIELISVLGSVCNEAQVRHTLDMHDVKVVLHAAAYKHVPLVEVNELSGLRNNVMGTDTLAKMAVESGVERFVLISTDKAVRPTNVMGASKRLAELVIQDIETRAPKTIFSMVRFGNVLGSSGSVIPLFRKQITAGGPITLTHEDITRFFMSISEAAHLVLIAGSLATGGDVFVLDMGKSVRIKDLAKRLIVLSGLSVRDAENPSGDIEIITTGLRPGEKLYEELLISENSLMTPHPKILRAIEERLTEHEVARLLKDLRRAIGKNDTISARVLVAKWVEGYHQPEHMLEIERKSIE